MTERKHWVAALPMYNLTPALHSDWLALIARVADLLARQRDPLQLSVVEPAGAVEALHKFWRRPDLLLSQTCGYPLVQGLRRHVRIIGTPLFDAPGCDGASYTSAIVVRANDGPATLAACRGLRAAYNDEGSHSGMNALRYAVAQLARSGRFFSGTVRTGSHLASLDAVANGAEGRRSWSRAYAASDRRQAQRRNRGTDKELGPAQALHARRHRPVGVDARGARRLHPVRER
ncbi:phosphate/phosphite/phosphonate ABC transporter substrate-binding protein [Cupriavidus basilensis]